MSWTEAVALVGVVVAAIGYLFKYQTDVMLLQRNDRLERINRQLSDFYGPLLALTRSSERSWVAFRERHRPPGDRSYWRGDPPLTEEDAAAWRLWMTTVFMPMHQQMMDLVLNHADLIDESEMPLCLLDLCAHVSGYQAVLKQWESGDISVAREDNISVVNFPSQELTAYAAVAFGRLKTEQGRLLGLTTGTTRSSRRR
jgi:hypothetical protein